MKSAMTLIALCLLVFPAAGIAGGQALLEYRVFEATPELNSEGVRMGTIDDLDAAELTTRIQAMENNPRGRGKESIDIPGLGPATRVRLISAPRIISSEGERAVIETGEKIPTVTSGEKEIDVTFRSALVVESAWSWESDDTARLYTKTEVSGKTLEGTFRIQRGETAYLTDVHDGKAIVVTVTFQPLE